MKLSVITPSFRNSAWLKLCIASVADQEGIEMEHIIQDGGSDDGTLDWLPADPRIKAFVEKDAGMYDAINRGLRKAGGEVLSYLNCDEQYLPGTLRFVHDYFEAHPEVDILLPDTIMVGQNGEYLCHRYSLPPIRHQMWFRFNVTTSSMFFRRRVIEDLDVWFDPQWRILGDYFWLLKALDSGARFKAVRRFASTFTETGGNLALSPAAAREQAAKLAAAPAWVRALKPAVILEHRVRMLLSGAFLQKPFDYSIYSLANPGTRSRFYVENPTTLWRRPVPKQ